MYCATLHLKARNLTRRPAWQTNEKAADLRPTALIQFILFTTHVLVVLVVDVDVVDVVDVVEHPVTAQLVVDETLLTELPLAARPAATPTTPAPIAPATQSGTVLSSN
jgi:hypothetical protein